MSARRLPLALAVALLALGSPLVPTTGCTGGDGDTGDGDGDTLGGDGDGDAGDGDGEDRKSVV